MCVVIGECGVVNGGVVKGMCVVKGGCSEEGMW